MVQPDFFANVSISDAERSDTVSPPLRQNQYFVYERGEIIPIFYKCRYFVRILWRKKKSRGSILILGSVLLCLKKENLEQKGNK